MYIKRELSTRLTHYATKYPVVAVVGPRQSGKTTLTRKTFPSHTYVSLEDPATLILIKDDPRAFLEKDYGSGLILDEFQQEPQLLSYIQGIVDNNYRPGYFVLTGSQNFLMNQSITQSLAGRVAVLTLLPLSCDELAENGFLPSTANEAVFTGCYPALFSRNLKPDEFAGPYVATYLERDVRQLTNIVNLEKFTRFLGACAGRIGRTLEYKSLADDCGVDVKTVQQWLSIMQASYVIFLVQPHFKNFNKRLVKSPKLYFYDTGLACYLLKIASTDQLSTHYLKGELFESFMMADFQKKTFNQMLQSSIYFWRDNSKNEVDCIIDQGETLVPVEIKASTTFNASFFDGVEYYCKVAKPEARSGFVVYGGEQEQSNIRGSLISWKNAARILLGTQKS